MGLTHFRTVINIYSALVVYLHFHSLSTDTKFGNFVPKWQLGTKTFSYGLSVLAFFKDGWAVFSQTELASLFFLHNLEFFTKAKSTFSFQIDFERK